MKRNSVTRMHASRAAQPGTNHTATRNRLRHIRNDERGISIIVVSTGLMALLAATTLAIDVGMFMTARTQAQTSADAGALAGAVALAFNNFNDRTPSGPAVQGAMNAALANQIIGGPVSITSSDVTFPNDPSGQPTRVQVNVFRTANRSNPVPTLMGQVFGVQTVDISATATAEAAAANAEMCLMPWTIPDKWIDRQSPPWDPSDTFTLYDNSGNPLANPDVYIPADQPGYTGYNAVQDRGLELVLKANNTTKVSSSFYNPWDLPGSVGANDYRNNIETCNRSVIPIFSPMTPEPGNMVGPTAQGATNRISQDPNAYWDTTCNCVRGSAFTLSPRIVIVPVYDPMYFAQGVHNGRNASLKLANYLGFFLEQMQGNQVMGRITPIAGLIDPNAGPGPAGAFARKIRLVQ
jgi:hypothetical protein